MESRDPLAVIDMQRGAAIVQFELLRAVIESHPARVDLVRHGLSNAKLWHDRLLASTQSEATLSGLEMEIRRWASHLAEWEAPGSTAS